MTKMSHPELPALLRDDFAKRAAGFRCADVELAGYPNRAVHNAVVRGVKSGLLHRAKVSHKEARYFGDARLAMEHQAKFFRPPAPAKSGHRPIHSWTSADEPVNTVEIQRCPTPPERFAVTGPVVGGFASLGPGRYLE